MTAKSDRHRLGLANYVNDLIKPKNLESVLRAECAAYLASGQYQLTLNAGTDMVNLGDRHNESLCVLVGIEFQGWGAIGLGEFTYAQELGDRGVALYDADLHSVVGTHWVTDQKVAALATQVFANWFRGYPDQSIACSEEAIAYSRALNHESTLVWALTSAGAQPAAVFWRDIVTAERLATEVMSLPADRRSLVDLAWGRLGYDATWVT